MIVCEQYTRDFCLSVHDADGWWARQSVAATVSQVGAMIFRSGA